MADRVVVHVAKDAKSGRFAVRREDETVATYPEQADAVQAAYKLLEGADKGELHVYNQDGTIVSEFVQHETASSRPKKKARSSGASKPKPKPKPAAKARKRSTR
jgi:hypothetical protein